jgi:TonB-linked SusC/RagA family outer membrane protein
MKSWMLRATVAAALWIAVVGIAAGQQATTGAVTGRVVKVGTQEPINGAQVFVVGTQLGQITNAQGRYLIVNVPAGSRTIRLQMMGYAADDREVTVTAGGTVSADFEGREQAIAIAPVVATALGIERSERGLGYAVQSLNSSMLDRIPETTLVQALAAQSAGVQVVSSSGRPGAGARITIRGESSFQGSGQPLFVIDGMPVSMDADGPSNPLGDGAANTRGMDIDMENIEEISVLRGAAATALYGSRAAAGAVIIRTKQGKAGQPLRFTVTSEVRQDRPIIEGYVTEYAQGERGYYCNGKLPEQGGWCMPGAPGTNPASARNWGPHKDSIPQMVFDSVGEVRFRDAREDFYETAHTVTNSVRALGSIGELGTFTFGVSHLNQGDIFPLAKLERLNLNANISMQLSSYLRGNLSVQRINTENAYNNDSWNGFTRTLINLPPTRDIREAWNEDGTPIMLTGSNDPHPEWRALNEYYRNDTKRWIVSQQFELSIVPGLRLSNRWGLDTYLTEGQRFENERPWRTAAGLESGETQQRKNHQSTINDDLVLSLDGRRVGETGLTVSGLIGGNLYMREQSEIIGEGEDVTIPGFYNISNFGTQTVEADLPTMRRLVGAYGQMTIDYNDWAFLNLTARNDWSSTLPKHQNAYFYPSASLGLIFTDALGWQSRWLQYGKLRLSYAKVGSDAPPYRLSTRYLSARPQGADNAIQQFSGPDLRFPFRDQNAYFQSTQLGNPDLKPESTVEAEIGLELRLLDGRARADISYYNKSSYDQIFSVPSSAVTGYNSITRNAGDLRNRGIEVTLQGRPIQTQNFHWNVRGNWSRNRSAVLELAPGVTSISLAGYSWPQVRIMEGHAYGVIWGYGWQRNDQGQLLIGDDGYPIRSDEQMELGSVEPDWLANFSSDISYRGIGLSGLLDVRKGGKILNFETQYMVTNGRSIITRTRGTPIVHEGVNINTGQPNTVELIRDQDYYGRVYGFDRHENQIEPAGFIKLREVTLSYVVPAQLLRRFDVQSATLYLTGRNLGVWSDFSMGDPEGDVYGGQNAGGQYFRQFPQPQTRSWLLGVRTNF